MLGREILFLPFGEEHKTHTYKLGQPAFEIGQLMMLPDGRTFRFGSTGATSLVAGTLQQSSVPVPNHIGQTAAASDAGAVGATAITATIGNTSLDADQYGNGVIVVESGGTGIGYYYPLVSLKSDPNKATLNAAASAQVTFAFNSGTSVQKAFQASTDVFSLIANPWSNVVINATAQTAPTCGVALVVATTHGTISATGGNAPGVQMGDGVWLQVGGLCLVRQDSTTVVAGQPVVSSATTAGDVALATTLTNTTHAFVGQCVRVAASAAFSTINLQLCAQ